MIKTVVDSQMTINFWCVNLLTTPLMSNGLLNVFETPETNHKHAKMHDEIESKIFPVEVYQW